LAGRFPLLGDPVGVAEAGDCVNNLCTEMEHVGVRQGMILEQLRRGMLAVYLDAQNVDEWIERDRQSLATMRSEIEEKRDAFIKDAA
jgi:hypothetical protein